jgi:hypothetical protein
MRAYFVHLPEVGSMDVDELVSEYRERRLWSAPATCFSLGEPLIRILCYGKKHDHYRLASQLPNRDVLWTLLLIAVLVLLLWFFGIVEFDVGHPRWS